MVRRGRLVWEDSLRSRQDHVPGMGPHRVGMGDTNSGGDTSSGGHCTTQRTSVKLELLNSDAVSRPIEKNARVIQLCFDVIKHGFKKTSKPWRNTPSMAPRHGGNLSQVSQVCPINLLLRKTSPPPMLVVEAAEATFLGKCCGTPCVGKKSWG